MADKILEVTHINCKGQRQAVNYTPPDSNIEDTTQIGCQRRTATQEYLDFMHEFQRMVEQFRQFVPYIGASGDVNLGYHTLVASGLRITNNPVSGYYLACDASGNAFWIGGPTGEFVPYTGAISSVDLGIYDIFANAGDFVYISVSSSAEVANLNANYLQGYTYQDIIDSIPSVTGYVPYTGAISSVDLGEHTLTASSLYVSGEGTISLNNYGAGIFYIPSSYYAGGANAGISLAPTEATATTSPAMNIRTSTSPNSPGDTSIRWLASKEYGWVLMARDLALGAQHKYIGLNKLNGMTAVTSLGFATSWDATLYEPTIGASISYDVDSNTLTTTSNISAGIGNFEDMTIVVTSLVENLNSDMLDDYHASSFSLSGHSHSGTYVPYLGAVSDVDLGSYGLTSTSFTMPTSATSGFILTSDSSGNSYWTNHIQTELYIDSDPATPGKSFMLYFDTGGISGAPRYWTIHGGTAAGGDGNYFAIDPFGTTVAAHRFDIGGLYTGALFLEKGSTWTGRIESYALNDPTTLYMSLNPYKDPDEGIPFYFRIRNAESAQGNIIFSVNYTRTGSGLPLFEVDDRGKIISNAIQLLDNPIEGYLLASDASGNASWVNSTATDFTFENNLTILGSGYIDNGLSITSTGVGLTINATGVPLSIRNFDWTETANLTEWRNYYDQLVAYISYWGAYFYTLVSESITTASLATSATSGDYFYYNYISTNELGLTLASQVSHAISGDLSLENWYFNHDGSTDFPGAISIYNIDYTFKNTFSTANTQGLNISYVLPETLGVTGTTLTISTIDDSGNAILVWNPVSSPLVFTSPLEENSGVVSIDLSSYATTADLNSYALSASLSAYSLTGHNHSGAYEPVFSKGDITASPTGIVSISGGTGRLYGAGNATITLELSGYATTSSLSSYELLTNKLTGTALTTSATSYPSSYTVKTYVDAIIGDANALVYKGPIDCSGNPNYPSADAGWLYVVSASGKIGGASGINVEVGDMCICNNDNTPSGNQATVGIYWHIFEKNIDGAVTGPASSVNDNIALFNGATGKIIKDSGFGLSTYATTASLTAYALSADVSGNYVPYSNAISSVDLGAFDITATAFTTPSGNAVMDSSQISYDSLGEGYWARLNSNGAETEKLWIYDNINNNYASTFMASGQSGNIDYYLPSTQGESASVLTNDGSGTLSWNTPEELGYVPYTGAVSTVNLSGQNLITTGTVSATYIAPMSAQGDIIYGGVSGAATRLTSGTTSTVLHGGTSPSWGAVVETDLSFSDTTLGDTSINKHGLAPKLSNNINQYFSGVGTFEDMPELTWYLSAGFTDVISANVAHNYGQYPVVQVLDSNNSLFMPASVVHNTKNDFTVTFAQNTTGTILVTIGSSQLFAMSQAQLFARTI